jgi:D-alanine transaminase
LTAQQSKNNNCDEAIMYRNRNFITEGSHSNVSILKDGKLITAPNSKYILPGVTRAHIIEIANQNKIPVEERRYSIKELLSADEIIISSSSKMARGVSLIDNIPVGGKDEKLLSLFRDNIYNNYINATT